MTETNKKSHVVTCRLDDAIYQHLVNESEDTELWPSMLIRHILEERYGTGCSPIEQNPIVPSSDSEFTIPLSALVQIVSAVMVQWKSDLLGDDDLDSAIVSFRGYDATVRFLEAGVTLKFATGKDDSSDS